MNSKFNVGFRRLIPLALLAPALSACDSMIYDDLAPCESTHRLKFVYDYNMKYADAFPAEVKSVNVWVFDANDRLVWQTAQSGEELSRKDYSIDLPLSDGKYKVVSWCGLDNLNHFVPDTQNPISPADLAMNLTLEDFADEVYSGKVSRQPLSGLYHNLTQEIEIKHDPAVAADRVFEIKLVKDTNYIKILLQNLDGSSLRQEDFSFHITASNGRLLHDNTVVKGEEFRHHPWMLTLGETSLPSTKGDGTQTSVSSLLAEMTMSRLMTDGDHTLVVRRNSDGKDIIRIPLVDYLLLVKGNYRQMSDQEYLDRQDEHTMTFFLDHSNNWYRSMGIYVNAWHVVPPQDENIH